jgi:transcriptional regulator with XRE-family HTH domain
LELSLGAFDLPETTIDRVAIARNRIHARIKELGWTQEAAARRCGLQLRTLQRLMKEGSHEHGPWVTTCAQVAYGLETTIGDLWTFRVYRVRHSKRR